jgi:hypothetical protein
MEKVVRITTAEESGTDYRYWKSRSYAERLQAIEFLRQQYLSYQKNAEPGFRSVCRIVNSTQG